MLAYLRIQLTKSEEQKLEKLTSAFKVSLEEEQGKKVMFKCKRIAKFQKIQIR